METIKLDLIPGKKMPSLHASQFDDGRAYHIDLTENRVPYVLDGTETISVIVRKCDNTLVSMDIANTFANKSYLEFEVTEQMTACAGFNYGEIILEKNGDRIGSLNFYLVVEAAPDENGITSQSEIKNLNRQITEEVDRILPNMVDEIAEPIINEKVPEKVAELVPSAVATVAGEIVPPLVNELVPQAVGDNYYNKTQTDTKFSTKNELNALDTKVINAIGEKKSIYNKNDTTRGYYYDGNGDIVENPAQTWRITDEMPIAGFDFITYSGLVTVGTTPCSFWRLEDESKVVFKQKVGENSIEPPEGAVAIAFSVQQNDYEGFSVVGTKKSTIIPNAQFKTSLFIGANSGEHNEEAFDYIEAQSNEGCFNTAVGVKAMADNLTGDHCTAVGFQAMESNQSGDANTAVGEDALFANVSGTGNTVVGAHAMQNAKGSGTVAVGQSALQAQTTGYFNTAVGNEVGKGAGTPITTDDRLTLVGNKAGKNVATILSNSTAVGSGAMVSKSNQVVLGNGSVTELVVGNYVLKFNPDYSVTWEARS